jgi:predicted permease
VERLEALPGVVAASVASAMPYAGLSETRRFLVAGRPAPAPGREPAAGINAISPHYFPTVGTRLLQGRAFADADTGASAKVYLINESMARGLFGDASPLGHRLMPVDGNADQAGEIVGVVADTKSASPDPSQAAYQVYRPMPQEARRANIVAVRTAGIAPSSVVESIRAAMAALDPDLPVLRLQPADFAITRQNYQLGVLGRILSALAALGLSLASLGVYGVMARTMAQRTNEFGIRVALGAQIADITRLVLASGVKLALLGSGLGLVGAVGVARLITAGFPGIHAQSPLVLAGVTVLLILVALLACWLPARRAARVDPITALRAE